MAEGPLGSFVFIVNPRSSNGATAGRFERILPLLKQELGTVDVKLTEHPRHATELARAAIRSGARAIVSVGGDGTNNEVINGFFDEAGAPLAGDHAFGVITSGTGGDFRRSFGWPLDPRTDVERLKRFSTRRIDVGRVVVVGDDGAPVSRVFLNIASLGLSAAVVDVVNASSKALGAKLSFMLGSARAMVSYRPQRVAVSIDNGEAVERDITFVAVSNAQFFGGGMRVAPEALPDDGAFDCVIVEGGGLSFWIRHGLKLYSGAHLKLPQVKSARCVQVDVAAVPSDARVMVEADGESPGRLPARFSIIPHAVSLIV